MGGEYYQTSVDRPTGGNPKFDGWYVAGSWVLTGELKGYNVSAMNNEIGSWGAPRVSRPFSLKGGSWGAWEFVTRYSDMDLNWHEGVAGLATPAGRRPWRRGKDRNARPQLVSEQQHSRDARRHDHEG